MKRGPKLKFGKRPMVQIKIQLPADKLKEFETAAKKAGVTLPAYLREKLGVMPLGAPNE